MEKANTAFIFLGHNDTKASSVNHFANPLIPSDKQRILYEDLIAKLRIGEPKHVEAFAAVLQELAGKHHLEYMDVYTPMQKLSTKNELVNATDGVHLTFKGHDFVALETLRYLNKE